MALKVNNIFHYISSIYKYWVVTFCFYFFCNFFGYSEIPKKKEEKEKFLEIYDHLYRFNFLVIDSIVRKNEVKNKNIESFHLLKANLSWWKLICGDNSRAIKDNFVNSINEAEKIIQIGKNSGYTNDNLRDLIICNAFKSRFSLLNKNYLSAVQDLKNCIDYLKTSFGKEEEYPDFLLTSGLYNYFSDYACEQYAFARMVFKIYPRGNKHKGLLMLAQATQKPDIFLKTESHYFLMKIYFDLEKDYVKAKISCRALLNLYPENHIYQLYWINIQKQLNQLDDYKLKVDKYVFSVNSNNSLNEAQKQHLLRELEKITHPN